VAGLVLAACGGGEEGTATPFSLGGDSQIQGFTPTPTAQVIQVTPEAPATPSGENGENGGNGGSDPGLEVFLAKGCTACHTIQGVPGAVGMVGPELTNVAINAVTRTSLDAEAYIRQSILEPSAFIVEGFPPAMPAGLVGEGPELDALVQYLLTRQ